MWVRSTAAAGHSEAHVIIEYALKLFYKLVSRKSSLKGSDVLPCLCESSGQVLRTAAGLKEILELGPPR